jgi:hypothetical protein
MKTKYFIPITLLFFAAGNIIAQKIIDKDISFTYIRLPQEPIGRAYQNYQSYVVPAYAAENAAKKADYEKKKADADAQYQMDLAIWSQKDKAAQDQYNRDMDTYNKKTTAQKLLDQNLLNQGKPVRQQVPMPVKNYPPEPQYKKEYDSNLLSSYIKLDGFKNAGDNAVVITVTLYGFDGQQPQLITTQKTVSDKNGSHNVNVYHYETQYKHPMSVKVEAPGKGVIMNQSIEAFNNYSVEKTPESDQPAQMDATSYLKNLEERVVVDNLKFINNMLNEKYGFSKAQRNTILYSAESKKENYDDLKSAYDNALAAYNSLIDDKGASLAKLKTSIDTWLKEASEANMNDKKARIDGEVGAMVELNLAEAFMWMDDYDDAQAHLAKLSSLDPSRHQRHHGEELAEMIKQQKKLFDANK